MRFRTRFLCAASAAVAMITLQGALLADAPATKPEAKLDARQILLNTRNFYKSASSLRVDGVMDTTFKQDGKVIKHSTGAKFSIIYKRPNKFLLTSPSNKMYSDGKDFYNYLPSAKRYVKLKMSSTILKDVADTKTGLGTLGMLTGVNYSTAVSSYKLFGNKSVNGKEVYVLVLNLKPGAAIRPDVQAVQTLWVGKGDYCIYRNDITVKMNPKAPKGYKGKVPKFVETNVVRKATKFIANAPISDSLFKFHPPAGVKPLEKPKPVQSVVKKQAPDFSFKWTDGSTKKLSDFRGKKVILDFWAMPICEKHLPVIQSMCAHQNGKVQVIAVNLNRDVDKVKSYMKSKHLSFPVVWCDAQMVKTINRYGLRGLPTVFIISENGVIDDGLLGFPTEKEINSKL